MIEKDFKAADPDNDGTLDEKRAEVAGRPEAAAADRLRPTPHAERRRPVIARRPSLRPENFSTGHARNVHSSRTLNSADRQNAGPTTRGERPMKRLL